MIVINKIIPHLIVLLFFLVNFVKGIDENSTIKDFAKCEEYDANGGYQYTKFFKIDNIHHVRNNETIFHLKLGVMGVQDAHIALLPTPYVSLNVTYYELVLGGGANTFNDFRKSTKGRRVSLKTVKGRSRLSSITPLPLEIYAFLNGTISLCYLGNSTPILSVNDPSPITVNYISFGSWGKAMAKWFYDCPADLDDGGDEIEEVMEVIPSRQRLENKMSLIDYTTPPNNDQEYIIIETFIEIKQAKFVSKKSELNIRARLEMKWIDNRVAWDPNDYDNITLLRMTSIPSGIPKLRLLNGKSSGSRYTEFDFLYNIVFQSNGTVDVSKTQDIEFTTWCSEDVEAQLWPNDVATCRIQIGVNNYKIILIDTTFLSNSFETLNSGRTEWKVFDVSLTNYKGGLISEDGKISPQLEYSIKMQRNRNYYSKLFETPLIGVLVLLMLSCWTSHPFRTGICLVGVIVLALFFVCLAEGAPLGYVPRLMHYYVVGFALSWISLVVIVISSWLIKQPPKSQPYDSIISIMDNQYVRQFFVMGPVTPFEEMFNASLLWVELSQYIDRLTFIVNFTFFLVVLIKGF